MGAGHDHSHHQPDAIRHERPLWIAFGLTAAFLVVEIVGALWTNSLALLSDAAHMGTDVLALGISLFAVRMARRPPDARRTYGYARLEAIGALANGALLFLLAGYILWEAVGRFRAPQSVAATGMLVVAVLGLLVNLVSIKLLQAGAGENLNVKGAYLEVWSDMLGSVGVILGALLIRYTGWSVVDPIIAVLIGLWVLPRTWTLLREAGQVLMQGVPAGIDLDAVRDAMLAQHGVAAIHDLHVWALGSRQPVLTAHVVMADPQADADGLRVAMTRMLDERFDIEHATLQFERGACDAVHAHR
jgi:cobalt-zinc-cadmium efflux system protein